MSKKKKHSSSGKKPQAKKPQPGKQVQKPDESAAKNEAVQAADEQAEVHMNFYSAMSMLATVVAAGTMIFGMMIAGRGLFYVVQSIYDESQLDLDMLVETLSDGGYGSNLQTYQYAAGIVLAVVTLCSLVQTIMAVNPKKKPVLVLSLVTEALAIVPVVLYALSQSEVKEIANAFDTLDKGSATTMYDYYPIVLIVNLLFCLLNVSGQIYGLYKYNKTGKTC